MCSFVQQVKGEAYDIDDNLFQLLDHLESHPDYYVRDKVQIQYLTDNKGNDISSRGKQETVEMYFLRGFRQELLQLEFLEEFNSDMVKYTPPHDRPKQADPQEHWWDVKPK